MGTVHYGREGFVPNTHFVRAKNVDGRLGQFVDGFADVERAVAAAIALAEKEAYQDVILIAVESKGALIRVFKGVQWFAEADLNRQFPGSWRLVEEIAGEAPAPDRSGEVAVA
jgi:hypothetical protein